MEYHQLIIVVTHTCTKAGQSATVVTVHVLILAAMKLARGEILLVDSCQIC